MADNIVKNTLMKLGLTETEARVYLAMLKLGADTVQHVARDARISRTAAYEIISELEKKGLASTFTQGKRKNFIAEDPEKLEGYFASRIRDIQLELGALHRVLPEMRMLQGGGDKPRVRFYKGPEGVRALFRDLASVEPSELYEITNVDAVYGKIDPALLKEERNDISYDKIKTKVLHRGATRNPSPKVEYRELTSDLGSIGNFQGNIWIYGNRIAFTHFLGKIEVIIVDNEMFAETMRVLFTVAWSCATPEKKEKK